MLIHSSTPLHRTLNLVTCGRVTNEIYEAASSFSSGLASSVSFFSSALASSFGSSLASSFASSFGSSVASSFDSSFASSFDSSFGSTLASSFLSSSFSGFVSVFSVFASASYKDSPTDLLKLPLDKFLLSDRLTAV